MQNEIDLPLFFGLMIDDALKNQIANANKHLGILFLHDETGSYLQEFVFEKTHYAGKWIGQIVDVQNLETLENHIYSIITKVAGSIDRSRYPLKLVAVAKIPQTYVHSRK
jgi:hypothetical protein